MKKLVIICLLLASTPGLASEPWSNKYLNPQPSAFVIDLCTKANEMWERAMALEPMECDPNEGIRINYSCGNKESWGYRSEGNALKDWAERLYSGDGIDLCL